MRNEFSLPGEWVPQDAILLAWPRPQAGWAEVYARAVVAYRALVLAILRHERVLLLVPEDESETHAVRDTLQLDADTAARLSLIPLPYNDSWARDFGPLTLIGPEGPRMLDFTFNGWGGKFAAELDNAITSRLAALGYFAPDSIRGVAGILEGGSIESDGAGTLMTTRECLLHRGRNPALDRPGIERWLRETFALEQVLWVEHAWLDGDDTDGHIDMLARFCDPHTIAYVRCDDRRDAHFEPMQAMQRELHRFQDAQGERYEMVPLPFPTPCFNAAGERLPASYANFLILNGAVIVPTYQVAEDEPALRAIESLFPGRTVEPVPALPFIHQSGSVHCLTMQLPAGVLQRV
ncbi:MAG: agmatine deiminase family protein [Thiotrichales bacterium]